MSGMNGDDGRAIAAIGEATRSNPPRSIWPCALILGGMVVGCGVGAYLGWRLRRRVTDGTPSAKKPEGSKIAGNSVDKSAPPSTTSNGKSVFDWEQNYEEVVLVFPVAPHIKARAVQCKFNTNTVSVVVEGKQLLQGHIYRAAQPDDCVWELAGSGDSRALIVTLAKAPLHLGYWKSVLKVENGKEG